MRDVAVVSFAQSPSVRREIEHNEVDVLPGQHLEGLIATSGCQHPEAGVFQRVFDDLADGRLVIDHEDAVHGSGSDL